MNIQGEQKKSALGRTLDVYGLQELSDEPDPHATLPFISHHTLNLTRDLNDSDSNPNKTNKTRELSYINTTHVHFHNYGKKSVNNHNFIPYRNSLHLLIVLQIAVVEFTKNT